MIFSLNKTKNYFLPFLFLIFSSLSFKSNIHANDLSKGIEVGTAALKFPCAVLADYYDCKDEAKKAIIFSSLHLIMDILNVALKYKSHRNDVSPLETGLSFVNAVRLLDNIQKFSQIRPVKLSKEKKENKEKDENKKSDEKKSKKQKTTSLSSFKNLLYTFIKHASYFGDSASSVWFALENGEFQGAEYLRKSLSWGSSFQKLLPMCINNKKNELYTKLGFGATLLASWVSWALVFYAKNQINDRGRGFHVVNDAVLQQIIREVDQNAGRRISIERIEQIIRETHPVRDFGDGSCSICLDALRERGTISVIPGCHHVFCTQCLEQHANTDIRDNDFDFVHRRAEDATCPQCRGPLNGRQSFDLEN